MAVTLTINGQATEAAAGPSLFDYAERLGVQVPTSCQKQGKCKECIVEVAEGMECSRRAHRGRVASEGPLPPRVPLPRGGRRRAKFAATRCAAARCGSSGTPSSCPSAIGQCSSIRPSPATATAFSSTARKSIARPGPIHGIAMDLGTTTIVLRLFDLETGELVADSSFENPQRFGGSDVMSRIHYDTAASRQAADADGRRLPDPRHRGVSRRSASRSTRWSSSATRRCAICSSARTCTRSASRPTGRSRKSKWPKASGRRPASRRRGRRCLLPIHPEARVYGVPIISGHVGRRRGGLHAGGRPGATKTAWWRSWTSAPTPS